MCGDGSSIITIIPRLSRFLERLIQIVDRHTWNSASILRLTYLNFLKAQGAEAAASIAYYAIFSLFPLLLCFVFILSYFLVQEDAVAYVTGFIYRFMPVAPENIADNLRLIVQLRGPIGLVGLLGLAWSATGVFSAIFRNINRAWSEAKTFNFVRGKLVAIIIIALLSLLLFLSIFLRSILAYVPRLQLPGINFIDETRIINFFAWVLLLFVFFSLYRWVPVVKVRNREAIISAIVTTAAWQAASFIFTYFIGADQGSYVQVYGSLAAIIILLLWYYIGATILLIGAHLGAAIAQISRQDMPASPGNENDFAPI